jgi:pre-rRNA-processing protein TSR3
VNFGKATKLTTVEALSAALYIAGFKWKAAELLSIFSWGHTFLELNRALLENYASAQDSTEIVEMQRNFTREPSVP